MSILAFDLRADPNDRDRSAASPILDLNAQASADTHAAQAIANHKAADDDARRALKMMLDEAINPPGNLTVENRGEGDAVSGTQSLFNAPAKIGGRTWIAKLAAKLRDGFGIVYR